MVQPTLHKGAWPLLSQLLSKIKQVDKQNPQNLRKNRFIERVVVCLCYYFFLSCYHDYLPFSLSRKPQEEQKKDKTQFQEKKPTQNRFRILLKRSGKGFFSIFFFA